LRLLLSGFHVNVWFAEGVGQPGFSGSTNITVESAIPLQR